MGILPWQSSLPTSCVKRSSALRPNATLSPTSMCPFSRRGADQRLLTCACSRVRSLSIVLQDAEIVSSEQGLRDGQQAELCRILDGSHQVLSQLDKTLSENIEVVSTSRGLGNRAKRVWKRLSWDNEDILELRGRITSSVTLLHAFIGQISR